MAGGDNTVPAAGGGGGGCGGRPCFSREVSGLPLPPTSIAEDSHNRDGLHTSGSSQGLGFLNIVRTVKSLQRRDMMLKSRSARSVQSRYSNSTDGGGIVFERSSLLRTSEVGEAEEQHQHDIKYVGFVPSNGDTGDKVDDVEDPLIPPMTTQQALWSILTGKGLISACLLAGPLAAYAVYHEWSPTWIFWLSFVVMIPLAAMLSDFTEEAALHTNETIGGLLNASFGNAVEVVVGIQALLANEIRVVQASMLGSILSNLLLVLGCCFFFGGLYHKEQTFNATAATSNMGLLALSSIALILPTPFADYYMIHDEHVLKVSRISAVFMLFMYFQLLVFQLKTHTYLFESDHGESGSQSVGETPIMSFATSILGLVGTTAFVTIFSHFLVESIDGFTQASGISRTFVGLILLPIVGNAVEHMAAVMVAMKDKMDLSMGICVGSCSQISLFVVPLMVLVGYALDKPMTLNFPHIEVILYVMSVMTVSIVTSNPTCNWLSGSLLITTYLLIATGFWFEEVQENF